MIEPVSLPKFVFFWGPAFAAVTVAPPPVPPLGQIFFIHIAGIPIPFITCLFAALGIALSRPLARKAEAELGWPLFFVVSAIMLVLLVLWIIESRPSWLYAFVVSIGMGFSGYSLLELFGEQVKEFVRDVFDKARQTIGRPPGKDND